MKHACKIKEMSEEERPYEKCLLHGASHLSDTELLAVLLRTGVKGINSLELAQNILQTSSGESSILNIHHHIVPIPSEGDVDACRVA